MHIISTLTKGTLLNSRKSVRQTTISAALVAVSTYCRQIQDSLARPRLSVGVEWCSDGVDRATDRDVVVDVRDLDA